MKVLFVHPSPLMYSEVHLKLEPLGLELVAESARLAGHDVRLVDLQVFNHAHLKAEIEDFDPDAVGFSNNYLANVPEILDLAAAIKRKRPKCFVFVGGHSGSFIAAELLEHSAGNIDCVVRGEGEGITPRLLEAVAAGRSILDLPGIVTAAGHGPPPTFADTLDTIRPARDLTRRRNKYFIGILDPSASIEFSRGCPWDCNFCSAWTFYGRKYRKGDPERIGEELESIREPNAFIVDDVAFIDPVQGHAIADVIERRKIKKQYYLETRADVLLKNKDVFQRWARLGLQYMFLGLEAIDDEGLKAHRKRITMGKNYEALDVARKLGIEVAVNVISDPSWDEKRFDIVKEWALSVPEFVHLTVATPYPGTEIWLTEQRRLTTHDYRLFDVQHAVVPTKMPLDAFYKKLVETQQVINMKQLCFKNLKEAAVIAARLLGQGQQNFARMLWKFDSVYNADRQFAEHQKPVKYAMRPPKATTTQVAMRDRAETLYVHAPMPSAAAGA